VGLLLDFVCGYYLFLFLNCWRKPKNLIKDVHYNPHPPRFAILVPAYNEEKIIGDIIRDLLNQDYAKDRFKIFVVGDHCNDGTKEIVESFSNVVFLDRQEGERGKNFALQYALNKISTEDFDILSVFDADARVKPDFLGKVAPYFVNPEIHAVQSYVATKNPNDSLITKLIYYEFLIFQRLWQMSKEVIGLSPALAGTGESFRMSTIKEIGWGTLLTEDLELTTKFILKKRKIVFAREVSVYDEKPQTMWKAYKQRRRWAAGHMQTCRKYIFSCLKAFVLEGNVKALDHAFYLLFQFNPFNIVISMVVSLLGYISIVSFAPRPPLLIIFGSFAFIVIILIICLLQRETRILDYILPFHCFLFHWVIADIGAIAILLSKHYTWERTGHGLEETIDERYNSEKYGKILWLLCAFTGAWCLIAALTLILGMAAIVPVLG
jgi:cellulose synthase/poly-beta-1,6-N-acetylglucosamine synthase-like glycosyltransferase